MLLQTVQSVNRILQQITEGCWRIPEHLVNGMRVVLSLFDNAKGIFGVEDNKKDCIEKLQRSC